MTNYAFLEGAEPGVLAHVDQIHAEHSHRIMSAVMLTMCAKVLYNEDRDDSKYLVEMITETISNTYEGDLKGMFALAVEMMANDSMNQMGDAEQVDLLRAAHDAVAHFRKMDADESTDCD